MLKEPRGRPTTWGPDGAEGQPLVIDERPPKLDAYRKKRDPDRTPEPFGGRRPGTGALFVIQQHAARRLHYDVRLEMDGVLKSWAVPKGPSVRPEIRRLAVHVEDHPLEYADFEGVIPKDNYGAGAVIVWDHGRYRSAKPEDLRAQLERGLLEVELQGHKLRGRWTFARMGGRAGGRAGDTGKEWLLIRKAGEPVPREEATERYPRSVRSGLTLDEMRDAGAVRDALRARLRTLAAPVHEVPARSQEFMLATMAERPPEGREWLFEIKYDGVRVLAERRGDAVTLLGRSGQVVTGRYPEVVAALEALVFDRFLIDGEIVALDDRGVPSFQRLQARMGLTRPGDVAQTMGAVPVEAVFFDCLALEGHDLRRLPLTTRKACLERVLPPQGVARYGDHVAGSGPALLEAAAEARLEGVVAKRATSPYATGRSDAWRKLKVQRRQEFVIGGYTDPQGSRARFGALHVGVYEGDRLVYVSKVGTGFDDAALERLWRRLEPLRRDTSPFDAGTPAGRGHHWVEPRLVCEVRFTEWTRDGGLRQPAYLGLRDDKRPEECRRETPGALEPPDGPAPAAPGAAPREAGGETPAAPVSSDAGGSDGDPDSGPGSRVRLTNLGKVFWPAEGYTKGDLIGYYDAIAPWLAPLPPRPPHRPHPLSGRDRRQVLLPEGRAGLRARVGPHGAHLLEGHRPRHRLLRRRRRRDPPVRGEHGHDPDPRLERAGRGARAPGLARPRSGSEGGAVHGRRARRAGPPSPPRRPRAAGLREDVRRHRAARAPAPRRAVHARADPDAGAASRHAGRPGRAGHRHGGPPARRARAARCTSTSARTAMARPSSRRSRSGRFRALPSRARSTGRR